MQKPSLTNLPHVSCASHAASCMHPEIFFPLLLFFLSDTRGVAPRFYKMTPLFCHFPSSMSSRSSISRIARPSVVRDNRTSASSSPCGGIGATDNGTLTDLSYPITSSCSSSATTNGSFDSARLSSSTSFNTQEDEPSSSTKATLTIGTKVIVPSLYVIGTLRYLGETRFKPGIWAGIELDLEGAGKNDGSVQG